MDKTQHTFNAPNKMILFEELNPGPDFVVLRHPDHFVTKPALDASPAPETGEYIQQVQKTRRWGRAYFFMDQMKWWKKTRKIQQTAFSN